jgi:hypothetical protein
LVLIQGLRSVDVKEIVIKIETARIASFVFNEEQIRLFRDV